MNEVELSAQAANLQRAIGSPATCNSAVVESLKAFLLPESSPKLRTSNNEAKPRRAPANGAKKGSSTRSQRQERVVVCEDGGQKTQTVKIEERVVLATKVVNQCLKSLTEGAQKRACHLHCRPERTSLARSSSISSLSTSDTPRSQTPLRPISGNQVITPRRRDAKRSSLSRESLHKIVGFKAQARCAQIAFACLRSERAKAKPKCDPNTLVLEAGVSALIHKMIALSFYDLALKELKSLKYRLLGQAQASYESARRNAPIATPYDKDVKSSSKESLTVLLDFCTFPQQGLMLPLVITTQMQVLRILADRDVDRPQGILEQMDFENPGTLVDSIQSQIDVARPETKDKAAHQLEMVAQMVLKICSQRTFVAEVSQSENRSILPDTMLELQITALVVRAKSWQLSGHVIDAANDVFTPLTRSLEAFRVNARSSQTAQYQSVSEAFDTITTLVHPGYDPSGQELAPIYQALAGFARGAGRFKDAILWIQKVLDLSSKTASPSLSRCLMLCKSLTLRLQTKDDSNRLMSLMTDVVEFLSGDLHGNSVDLDELLITVASLRKAIASVLLADVRESEASETKLCANFISLCLQVVALSIKFIVRYLGNTPGRSKDERTIVRHQHRKRLVQAIAKSTVEVTGTVARVYSHSGAEDWQSLDATLSDCVHLIGALGDPRDTTTDVVGNDNDQHSQCTSISNAYWSRYLVLKKHNANFEQQKLYLRTSIDVANMMSNHQPVTWLLPRLEQSGQLFEKARDHPSALEAYMEALQAHVDLDIVAKVANLTRDVSLAAVFEADGETKSLARALQAYIRVSLKVKDLAATQSIYYDPPKLPDDQRLLLLYYQFTALASELHSRSDSAVLQIAMRKLSNMLLSVCTGNGFMVRRTYLLIQMLYIRINHPSAIESSTLSSALEQTVSRPPASNDPEYNLQAYVPQLTGSLSLLVALRKASLDHKVVENVLRTWACLAHQASSYASLQAYVYDMVSWRSQLDLIIEYLSLQDLQSLKCLALYIATVLCELPGATKGSNPLLEHTQLGQQYIRLGYTELGGSSLRKAHQYLERQGDDLEAQSRWYLACAELALETSNFPSCNDQLQVARANLCQLSAELESRQPGRDRVNIYRLIADADLLQARLAATQSDQYVSLLFARLAVKGLQQVWMILDRRQARSTTEYATDPEQSANDSLTKTFSELEISSHSTPGESSAQQNTLQNAAFWTLVPRLLQGLWFLCFRFAHAGLFLETEYYIGEARKIAKSVNASLLWDEQLLIEAQCAALSRAYTDESVLQWRGDSSIPEAAKSHQTMVLEAQHGAHAFDHRNGQAVLTRLRNARQMLCSTRRRDYVDQTLHGRGVLTCLAEQFGAVSILDSESPKKPKRQGRAPALTKTSNVAQAKNRSRITTPSSHEISATDMVPLCRSENRIQQEEATIALGLGDLTLSSNLLEEIDGRWSDQGTAMARIILQAEVDTQRGLRELNSHPVLNVVPESAISYPTVIRTGNGLSRTASSRVVQRQGRAPKQQPGKATLVKPLPTVNSVQEKYTGFLRAAQQGITGVIGIAQKAASTKEMHHVLDLFSRVILMITALTSSDQTGSISAPFLIIATELGRMVSMLQGSLAIHVEKCILAAEDPRLLDHDSAIKEWSPATLVDCRDLSTFQANYIDIIPNTWDAVSITLSESREEILVAKIRAQQNPFVLRIPLKRQDALDSQETSFGFEHAKKELAETIDLANSSSQDAQNQTGKAAKQEWWAARSALDSKLQHLLQNIESIWLGGFRGILSQHVPKPELLARFQQSLQSTLGKHLPSRQKPGKNKPAEYVTLVSHVLELFVGLGCPDESNDVDDQVLDLLYYVVDILQFNGERNAYDEIDFDSMVIETLDAIRHYHQASCEGDTESERRHTILILDRHLHCFPWESLPCLKRQSISRLPSLSCLRRRILQQRAEQAARPNQHHDDGGLRISLENGAYILNPSGDLSNTQTNFEEKIQCLPGWSGLTAQPPTETQFRTSLSSHPLFLYFGHGSGGQYIRARTIKKLDTCAVSLLMGCSSGALTDCGKFEPYGPPINYMHAGCPALLANLWDVTDKDIDRFALSVLGDWGLFEREEEKSAAGRNSPVKKGVRGKIRGKGKEPAIEAVQKARGNMSLDEAVAKARDVCVLKYLNGAAPVIYGIPVFLD